MAFVYTKAPRTAYKGLDLSISQERPLVGAVLAASRTPAKRKQEEKLKANASEGPKIGPSGA